VKHAVFFDLDGTLTDYQALVNHVLAELSSRVEAHTGVAAAEFLATYMQVQAFDEAQERAGLISVVTVRDRKRRFGAALRKHGIADENFTEELAHGYAEARRANSFPMLGATATLTMLKDAGVWVGIVTEGSGREQRGQIGKLGWSPLIDDLVISEEAGVHKPEPALVGLALLHSQANAKNTVFVGDRTLWDLAPAKSLGMTTVLMDVGLYPEEAAKAPECIDHRVHNHGELQGWLRNWLAKR